MNKKVGEIYLLLDYYKQALEQVDGWDFYMNPIKLSTLKIDVTIVIWLSSVLIILEDISMV